MFSALKKAGVRLYQLARQGKEVPREPRRVQIEQLQLRGKTSMEIEISVTCSRGTYIRTLAADIGDDNRLRRTFEKSSADSLRQSRDR